MVAITKNVDDVIDKYNILLDKLQSLINSSGKKTNIYNTKLGEYKRNFEKLEELNDADLANLAGKINDYNFIYEIFDNENIQYNKSELLKIIEGQHDDYQHRSNDILFEFSMAVRFAISTKNIAKINLDTECDVIVNESAAIECKCLHNEARINDNVRKAINQINKRIADGQAKYGLVALDLSNVAVSESDKKVIYDLFYKFADDFQKITNSGASVCRMVIQNNNFASILRAFLSHCIEAKFYQNLSKSLVEDKMSNHIKAIIYQASVYFVFSYDDICIPVPIRFMNYLINPNLTSDESDDIKEKIHSLEVGY
ncbi:MAG: hypothetical protein SFX46_00955 [Aeromonas hydrophila]|uniref:hypothetical protein n=1 Tax=Aeromonas hydrophila TaxID=644 RepID=UPI0029AC6687|nr:hypothetical protein [Aeromonas hydrophila]